MLPAFVLYSTKLSRDKFEPIFGDLALRTLPCNCFLGLFFCCDLLNSIHFRSQVTTAENVARRRTNCFLELATVQRPRKKPGCYGGYSATWTEDWTKNEMATRGESPMRICTDSQGALRHITTGIMKARTKYIGAYYHNSRDLHARSAVHYSYVENPADLLTKALAREKHEKFRRAMGVRSWATGSLMPLQNSLSRASLSTASISRGPTPACTLRFVAGFSRSGRPGTNQETTSLSHPPKSSLPSSPSLATQPCASQTKPGSSYLLGHPNWHRPEPWRFPRCEEEVENTEHTILRCPAHQQARESFPETLGP